MKNKLPLLLLSSMLTFTFQASAEANIVGDDACFVVSGGHFDHNGALNRLVQAENARIKYSFAGYKCSIFNSYKELKAHLATSGLEKNAAIFVLQIAHGGPSGTSVLNSGTLQSDQILKEVRDLSAKYNVAFLNQSCYGGTNLQDKLVWDEANYKSPSIDRICAWSDSSPGRVSVGLDSIVKSKDNYSLEDAYLAKPDGVISSAAWSEVEMTKYYYPLTQLPGYSVKNRAIVSKYDGFAENFISGVGRVISENDDFKGSSKVIIDSAKFVLASQIKDAQVKSYLALAKLGKYDFEATRIATYNAPASDDVCTLAVRKFVVDQWYPVFRSNDYVWGLFYDKLKALKDDKKIAEACPDSGIHINETPMEWKYWLERYSPIAKQFEPYARALTAFEDNFSGADSSAQKIMENAIEATDYSKPLSIEGKYDVVLSIIGRTILPEESQSTKGPNGYNSFDGYPNVGVIGATGNVMPAFMMASLKKPHMDHSLDERRRQACRSIQLKAW